MQITSVSLDYTDAARVGDGLEASADVQKIGSRLGFASAHLHVNGERIVRASAVFEVVAVPDPQRRT